jgi:hypothetical protein
MTMLILKEVVDGARKQYQEEHGKCKHYVGRGSMLFSNFYTKPAQGDDQADEQNDYSHGFSAILFRACSFTALIPRIKHVA